MRVTQSHSIFNSNKQYIYTHISINNIHTHVSITKIHTHIPCSRQPDSTAALGKGRTFHHPPTFSKHGTPRQTPYTTRHGSSAKSKQNSSRAPHPHTNHTNTHLPHTDPNACPSSTHIYSTLFPPTHKNTHPRAHLQPHQQSNAAQLPAQTGAKDRGLIGAPRPQMQLHAALLRAQRAPAARDGRWLRRLGCNRKNAC
jgi:hypothetical protein